MANTLRDNIRDLCVQYDKDTADGSAPDADALAETICDEIKDFLDKQLS